MAETLVRFTEAITGRDGRAYIATALGTRGSDGLWHGWLEFTDGTVSSRTTQESEQPNRDDLMYWAQGLTYVYLEGALERALHPNLDRVVGGGRIGDIQRTERPTGRGTRPVLGVPPGRGRAAQPTTRAVA